MFSGRLCTQMNDLLQKGNAAQAKAELTARERVYQAKRRAKKESGWRGSWVLLRRETKRFMSMAGQSVISPVLTTMLYFVVFGFTLGERLQEVKGIPYVEFLVPGLVMLNLINSAYMNSAFSLFLSKIHGSIVDLLVTPLTPLQIMVAYLGASLFRALLTGGMIWLVAAFMGADTIHNVPITIIFMVLTALGFALLGLVVAIWSRDFDQVNFLPSFLLMPLTFLGGVFYSIEMLPDKWAMISKFNPILYMVNGLRYGMTGVSDVPVYLGMAIVAVLVLAAGCLAGWMLASGKRLRDGS